MCQVKQIIGIVYINVILIFKIYDFDAKGVNSSVLKKKRKKKEIISFKRSFVLTLERELAVQFFLASNATQTNNEIKEFSLSSLHSLRNFKSFCL